MKKNLLKISAIAAFLVLIGAGVSLADDDRRHHRGHAYGHYKQRVDQHYHHYAPPRTVYVERHYRPVVVERHYRPVVVERHYYQAPEYYAAPAPSGFFFGMSLADAGSAFSFGIAGR